MFDYGLDSTGVINNIKLLGIDLGKAAAFCLSHGHFDHYSGVQVIKERPAPIKKGTPFYVGEEAFAQRFFAAPSGPINMGQLNKKDLERMGLNVVEVNSPKAIVPGLYLTGPIARTTPYEKAKPTMLIKRADKPEVDDFRGELAVFCKVKGKGLVVLSGCAHRGIVNAVKQAQEVADSQKVHAVLGGRSAPPGHRLHAVFRVVGHDGPRNGRPLMNSRRSNHEASGQGCTRSGAYKGLFQALLDKSPIDFQLVLAMGHRTEVARRQHLAVAAQSLLPPVQ
jgi:metal-dependent hydrolase (beta-lactamase superfamily II)